MRVLLAAALLVLAAPRAAAAGETSTVDVLVEKLAFFADEVRLKLDIVDVTPYGAPLVFGEDAPLYSLGVKVDVAHRTARLSLGAGDSRVMAFRLRTDVVLDRGAPRVRARLDLGVMGHRLSLKLPDVRVVPRFHHGSLVMQYEVPLLEGRF